MKRLFFILSISVPWMATAQPNYEPGERTVQLICGHRGGLYPDFPENSFSAFDHTVRNCKSMPVIVEFDLRKSRDGTLFVLHDETLDRTTNGQGKIEELPDTYVATRLLKNSKGEVTADRIPTFDSLLRYARNKNMILMLDVKADVWTEAVNKIVEEKLQHKCIVLTFTPEDSKRVFELSNMLKISCLIRTENDWRTIQELGIPAVNLIAYINENTPQRLVAELKNNLMMIMADMNESVIRHSNPLHGKWYKEFVRKRRLDILITDSPVEVSEKLR